jgi:ribosomal protein S27AE
MSIRAQMQSKVKPLRIGFFAGWLLAAAPLVLGLGRPYSYAVGVGFTVIGVCVLVGYLSIRCPQCGGSLLTAGMGFLDAPGAMERNPNCPKCGVTLGDPAGL